MGPLSHSRDMGHRSECVRGLLRNDRDHLLFFPCRGESGSGAYELGYSDYRCCHLLRGGLLFDVREESLSGARGRDRAVPDLIRLGLNVLRSLWRLAPLYNPFPSDPLHERS